MKLRSCPTCSSRLEKTSGQCVKWGCRGTNVPGELAKRYARLEKAKVKPATKRSSNNEKLEAQRSTGVESKFGKRTGFYTPSRMRALRAAEAVNNSKRKRGEAHV